MIKTKKLMAILTLSIVMFSSANNINAQGKIKSAKIGTQVWMVENLNVDKFRNGDLIPEAKTDDEWAKAGEEGKPAWCYYENNPENGRKYGKLYNGYAVKDERGLAPKGWHIPTIAEFMALTIVVKDNISSLIAVGQGEGRWAGTNTSGFSALLAGERTIVSEGNFNFRCLGSGTFFWSTTDGKTNYLYYMMLLEPYSHPKTNDDSNKKYGRSVRCVKD